MTTVTITSKVTKWTLTRMPHGNTFRESNAETIAGTRITFADNDADIIADAHDLASAKGLEVGKVMEIAFNDSGYYQHVRTIYESDDNMPMPVLQGES